MSIQTFEWGFINWIYESNEDENMPIYIGISYIKPKVIQGSHIHYGDEQIMYILQGTGKQYINGVEHEIKKDKWFRINIGSSHETINTGDDEIIKLLISFPVNNETTVTSRLQSYEYEFLKLEDIIDKVDFKDEFKFATTILSDENKIIFKSKNYTEYCDKNCNISDNPLNCKLMTKNIDAKLPWYKYLNSYKCEYNINVYNKPIVYNDKTLGYVIFGHINDTVLYPDHKETNIPKSTTSGILVMIEKFVENILNIYEDELTNLVLKNKNNDIKNFLQQGKQMEKSLNTLQDEMLSIKINNHFLFNTLNAIANLSLEGDKFQTYKSIIELSKLLRYSVEKGNDLVSISDELNYVKNYIDLQKLRYRKCFSVKYSIEDIALREKVPFNILQPIVENIFIHSEIMIEENIKIKINIEINDNKNILINIEDNGVGIKSKKLLEIQKSFREDNDKESGLVMIYKKLLSYYGTDFNMGVKSIENEGTKILIEIPIGEK